MNVLSLFNTTGYIFGPAILLTGCLAILLCLRASLRASSPRARRAAFIASLLPLTAGVIGALFGLALCWGQGQMPADQRAMWLALGKACLAGLVVSFVPLVWSLLLLRSRAGTT